MPSISPFHRFEKLLMERAQTWPISGCKSPAPMSRWQAASLLQKAIRRGDVPRVKLATSSLLQSDPARLWRRLGIIAFEDIGLANLSLVGQVTLALQGKIFRRSLGGEARVASGLATDLALSSKSRAADDMLCVIVDHPKSSDIRRKLAGMSEERLLTVVAACQDMTTRCIAADMCAVNCTEPKHLFLEKFLNAAGVGPSITWMAQEGSKRTGTLLPLFMALLSQQNGVNEFNPDDEMPEEIDIAGLPGWALDMFTREGKASIRHLLAGQSEVARYLRDSFPVAGRTRLLGEAVFRVESGLLRNRSDGPKGQMLRSQMERECLGIDLDQADQLLRLTRSAVPDLNECRKYIMGGPKHG